MEHSNYERLGENVKDSRVALISGRSFLDMMTQKTQFIKEQGYKQVSDTVKCLSLTERVSGVWKTS